MCTKRRESLLTLGLVVTQVHISSDRPGTGVEGLRGGIRELGPWQSEVFQRPLIKAQQGFRGRRHHLERGAVFRAAASADCESASEAIRNYVKLVAPPRAISARRCRPLSLVRYDENLRSFKAWLLSGDLTSHKSDAEKCTGEPCWCT